MHCSYNILKAKGIMRLPLVEVGYGTLAKNSIKGQQRLTYVSSKTCS